MLGTELIMSEFGIDRNNCGGASLSNQARLNPTFDGFRRLFPDTRVTLYTDFDFDEKGIFVIKVNPPFDMEHRRYGWRSHDFYQAHGLLQSKAKIAIAMDSDMMIVSEGFRAIVKIAERFGLAVPANPRLLAKIDGIIGMDSSYRLDSDETDGLGFAYNLTPIAFNTLHKNGRRLLERYCELMVAHPGRGAVALYQAAYELGFSPYLLPPQWCVCSPVDLDSQHLWKNAIALHVGHPDVLVRYQKECCKLEARS